MFILFFVLYFGFSPTETHTVCFMLLQRLQVQYSSLHLDPRDPSQKSTQVLRLPFTLHGHQC